MAVEVRVGPHGRVVIPAILRKELGLGPGSVLLVDVEDGTRLVLEERRASAARLRGSWVDEPGTKGEDAWSAKLIAERRTEEATDEDTTAGVPADSGAPGAERAAPPTAGGSIGSTRRDRG